MEPVDHLSMVFTTVVNYYDNENDDLVFEEEKLFIELEDVLRIIDLPIDSKPVITGEVEEEHLYALRNRLMSERERLTKRKRGFTLKSVRKILHKFE